MKRFSYTISDMYCMVCDTHLTVPRKKSDQREKGHRKDMYCPTCRCKRGFTEIREKDFVRNIA